MPRRVDARGARAAAGDAQVASCSICRKQPGRSAASRRQRWGECGPRACSPRRARSTSRKGAAPDYWRLARALFAAGFRRGRPRPQLLSPITSRRRARCSKPARTRSAARCSRRHRPDRAAGAGDRRPRARWLRGHAVVPRRSSSRRPTRWASTLPSLRKALVSAEAFPPSLRDALARARHRRLSGLRVARISATIAYETEAREGLVVDEGVLVEIVRPGTGDPVAPGRGRRGRRDHALQHATIR